MIHFIDVRCDDMEYTFIDVRCDGKRRHYNRGSVAPKCNYLLYRLDPDTRGAVETKCPQCNTLRTWILTPAMST